MQNIEKFLIKEAKTFGIKITTDQAQAFQLYMVMLIEWNQKMNLTAIKEEKEIAILHFLDSMSLLKFFEIKKEAKGIDIGTGAGFPGIPLKIMRPDLDMTLLDGTAKRLRFLEHLCDELSLKVTFIHERAEVLGKNQNFKASFDFAIARAVAKLKLLSEYCLPLVKKGGYFIAMKGPLLEKELVEVKPLFVKKFFQIKVISEFKLSNKITRKILIAEKLQ